MSPHPEWQPDADDLLVSGALALGLRLEANQLHAFRVYQEELARWSSRINLTGLRTTDVLVTSGFLDSLACLPLIPGEVRRILDIGSGAGFPALPLKIVRPDLSLTLVEASRKKAVFLQHVVRALGLSGVRVVQCRAEALAGDPREVGAYELGLARAVAPPPEQARLVRPFLCASGLFLLQLGLAPLSREAETRLFEAGFERAGEGSLPQEIGRPGRRILVLRRIEPGPAGPCFT